jgi:mediator of RNA polymerase II transcription subunit 16
VYEKFLANVDSVVRHAYQAAVIGNADRATPERELLITSNIPPVLQSAVVTILTKTMAMIRPEVDRMALCLHDYSWLGVGDDKRTELFKRSHDVDVLKKVLIRSDLSQNKARQPRRRCVRCCEVSEDVTLPKSFPVLKMLAKVGVLRSCVCGGMWGMDLGDRANNGSLPG